MSWYQPEPAMSLALIDRLRVPKGAPVIDVGGGASLLVDRLVARGYTDLAVLDVSSTALEIARRRPGDAAPVRWLHEDLLRWQPERRYALWHDRAVFHFLTDAAERAKYLTIMGQTLGDSGALIIATFASDGPERCSGLPVARYDAVDLERLLDGFTVVEFESRGACDSRRYRPAFHLDRGDTRRGVGLELTVIQTVGEGSNTSLPVCAY